MDDKTAWDLYFSGVAALQFHPKNDIASDDVKTISERVRKSAKVADMMLLERQNRWHG